MRVHLQTKPERHNVVSTKTLLITGASSGIGAAFARRVAAPGISLFLHARKSKEALADVRRDAEAKGARVELALGDLADSDVGERLVSDCELAFGGLDGLIANAGFPLLKSFAEGNASDIDYAFRGNLFSFFALARAGQSLLRRSGSGRIVAVGSFTAHVFRTDMPQFPMSAASKGALETAVRSLALEFARDGVTVNCVVPGYIEKDKGTGDGLPPERLEELQALIPVGRIGKPDDVAAMIEFLIGDGASYITGQSLHVNGGLI